jgi:hypothetical protein
VPTKETQLSTRTAPPARTDAIRFLIRSLRSIRISKSVYALNRAARAQNGNRRSGWLQQIGNTDGTDGTD